MGGGPGGAHARGEPRSQPMTTLSAAADAHIDASPEVVLAILRDLDGHHRRILPPAFSDFEVLHGGHGDGTLSRFKFRLGGKTDRGAHAHDRDEPGGDPGAGAGPRHGHGVPRRRRGRRLAGVDRHHVDRRATAAVGSSSGSSSGRCCAGSTSQELELLAAYAPSVAGSPVGGPPAAVGCRGVQQAVVPARGADVAARQPVQEHAGKRVLAEGQPDHRLALVARAAAESARNRWRWPS